MYLIEYYDKREKKKRRRMKWKANDGGNSLVYMGNYACDRSEP